MGHVLPNTYPDGTCSVRVDSILRGHAQDRERAGSPFCYNREVRCTEGEVLGELYEKYIMVKFNLYVYIRTCVLVQSPIHPHMELISYR